MSKLKYNPLTFEWTLKPNGGATFNRAGKNKWRYFLKRNWQVLLLTILFFALLLILQPQEYPVKEVR